MPKSISTTEPGSRTLSALENLPLFSQGVHPTNRTPTKSQKAKRLTGITILQQGIDTLVFSVYGTLREEVIPSLEWTKELAQASKLREAPSVLQPFFGVTPRMQATGANGHEWKLESDDIAILIRRPGKSKRPSATIEVKPACLWREGLGGLAAARAAEHYLRPLFYTLDGPEGLDGDYSVSVRRVDLATDFQGHAEFTDTDRRGVVSRVRQDRIGNHVDDTPRISYYGMDTVTGFAAGKSTVTRINYYDKTKAAADKSQDWWPELWSRHEAYSPGVKVNRCEFQMGREFLHNRAERIESLADLERNIARLWAYGMRWFSVRELTPADSHKSRWPVADWWSDLSTWEGAKGEPLPRVKQVRPKFNRICEAGFGYLTTAMALSGSDCPYETLDRMWDVVRVKKREDGIAAVLAAKRLRYRGNTMADA
jgi:hypothetical protein